MIIPKTHPVIPIMVDKGYFSCHFNLQKIENEVTLIPMSIGQARDAIPAARIYESAFIKKKYCNSAAQDQQNKIFQIFASK